MLVGYLDEFIEIHTHIHVHTHTHGLTLLESLSLYFCSVFYYQIHRIWQLAHHQAPCECVNVWTYVRAHTISTMVHRYSMETCQKLFSLDSNTFWDKMTRDGDTHKFQWASVLKLLGFFMCSLQLREIKWIDGCCDFNFSNVFLVRSKP